MQRLFATLVLISLAVMAQSARADILNPPNLEATAYFLQDPNSGFVLAEKNPDKRVEPASITKVMTVYVVLREIKQGNVSLDDMVSVSEKARYTPGSRMFIELGRKVKLKDMLMGIIVQSGNDASVALAEHIAGSEPTFAALMNRYATDLGLKGTNFTNSTGLPDAKHFSTARDIASLSQALMVEFPEEYKWFSIRKYAHNGIEQFNRNALLKRDKSVDGIKTGHTNSAGYCLAASAKRDGMRLISVVLGTRSEKARSAASQSLLNWGFRFYETRKLYTAGQPIDSAKVWKGDKETVPMGLAKDVYVTIPRGQFEHLQPAVAVTPRLTAPVKAWQTVGKLKVSLESGSVLEAPLLALEAVAEGGVIDRLVDEVKLLFEE